MNYNQFFDELIRLVVGAGGAILTCILPPLYKLVKQFLLQQLKIAEKKGEIQTRELFANFSKEAYNAVEQLNSQGVLDTSKKEAFDTLFKQNFPSVNQEMIDLYREAIVGKNNVDKTNNCEIPQEVSISLDTEISPETAKQVSEHINKTAESIKSNIN